MEGWPSIGSKMLWNSPTYSPCKLECTRLEGLKCNWKAYINETSGVLLHPQDGKEVEELILLYPHYEGRLASDL